MLGSEGFLNITLNNGVLSYSLSSPRFKPKDAETPEESLQLLTERAGEFASLMRVVLALEIDGKTLAAYLDTLPVTLKHEFLSRTRMPEILEDIVKRLERLEKALNTLANTAAKTPRQGKDAVP